MMVSDDCMPADSSAPEEPLPKRILLFGKTGTGKSSLALKITGKSEDFIPMNEDLQEGDPGYAESTTRHIILSGNEDYLFFDTPGLADSDTRIKDHQTAFTIIEAVSKTVRQLDAIFWHVKVGAKRGCQVLQRDASLLIRYFEIVAKRTERPVPIWCCVVPVLHQRSIADEQECVNALKFALVMANLGSKQAVPDEQMETEMGAIAFPAVIRLKRSDISLRPTNKSTAAHDQVRMALDRVESSIGSVSVLWNPNVCAKCGAHGTVSSTRDHKCHRNMEGGRQVAAAAAGAAAAVGGSVLALATLPFSIGLALISSRTSTSNRSIFRSLLGSVTVPVGMGAVAYKMAAQAVQSYRQCDECHGELGSDGCCPVGDGVSHALGESFYHVGESLKKARSVQAFTFGG